MYLSRIALTGEQIKNPYEVHRALWRIFPEAREQKRDFLYRVEQRGGRRVQVLMQSQRRPEIEADGVKLLASRSFQIKLPEDGLLRFLLVANPVKTISDEQGRFNEKGEIKKCRVPLIKEDEQIGWLKRKLEGAATVNVVNVEKQFPLYFRKGSRRGKIQPYLFKGFLDIRDAASLQSLLATGIGPAKSLGCGMLSLARA